MRTLICGSLAYDTIMVFPDHFKHHILPDKVHILNVSFLVPEMRREFGGVAGNIAYNLKLLGGEPVIMATVGDDFGPYAQRCQQLGLDASQIRVVPGTFTGQAFITTDLDDNQITAFHPGAMGHSHANHVADAGAIRLAIVAPDGPQGMLQHTEELHAAGIPFIFDPGQAMPLFSGAQLMQMLNWADYLAVNDYEAALFQERTGCSLEQLASHVRALVITQGAQGSTIYADGSSLHIPAVPESGILDPTGCGDAYRAGLLYGISHGWDWLKTGRLASMLGALKIGYRGGQNHPVVRAELAARYQNLFGASLWD